MGTISSKQKGRCMKFIWRYFYRKIAEVGNEPKGEVLASKGMAAVVSSDHDWHDGLNIRIHSAHGGKIVTFNRYDRKSDRDNKNVYVIPDEQDFERELGKLITLESMRG